jgi:hypothetical protein
MAGWSTPSPLVSGNTVTTAVYNQLRDSIIADSHSEFPLGGSDVIALANGGGYLYAPHWVPLEVSSTNYTGYVYKVIVEAWTENAATTITPRLWNITDSTAAVTGSASTATARVSGGALAAQQTLTFTLAAGKVYALQAQKSDDVYQCWIIGRVRRTHA